MGKTIIITEKPSVAQEYRTTLQITPAGKRDGYVEGYSPVLNKNIVITWCVGHLCTMSTPDAYDASLKKWDLSMLPFLPREYRYEVIPEMRKQFGIVKKLYHDNDLDAIYYAGDAGREGIYIQALVRQMAGHKSGIQEKVVWIDSYTQQEILRGIRDAKDFGTYEKKIAAAYMRAIEDYSIGMNFTRALTKVYGPEFVAQSGQEKSVISVGRVMSCVLGMVVEREREIREFKENVFYKIEADTGFITGWKADENSVFFGSPFLYNEFGFKERDKAQVLLGTLEQDKKLTVETCKVSEEKKKAPLLFNLAELQAECAKKYKIGPDETLAIAQALYEKKLTTYPRTDARVLSSAVAAEVGQTLNGILKMGYRKDVVMEIAKHKWHKNLSKPYVDDSKITDHYAIIPTGISVDISSLSEMELKVFEDILDRFLCIFFPPAVYIKAEVVLVHNMGEHFFGGMKTLKEYGYLSVFDERPALEENMLANVSKGAVLPAKFAIKEGKTTPPKRYNSGSMILAMENAGKLIEDEELREQIKGSGIGTSATRAEILKKLNMHYRYLAVDKKTQILSPTIAGETVYDIIAGSIPELLKPDMTASWEKGLVQIEEGIVSSEEYRQKLEKYVANGINKIKAIPKIYYVNKAVGAPAKLEVICPKCGKGHMFEGKKSFSCSRYKEGCDFSIWKEVAGTVISWENMMKLVQGQETSVIKGMKKRSGETFNAALKLGPDGKVKFVSKGRDKKEI